MILTHKSSVSNFSLLSRKKEPFTNLYLLKASVLIGQLSQRGGKKERKKKKIKGVAKMEAIC